MTEVLAEELHALLDGELPAHRAREVEAAVARDPGLRAEFEALRAEDAAWRVAAESARFAPTVPHTQREEAERGRLPVSPAALLLALIVLRVALKLAGWEAFGFVLAATSLLLLLTGLARLVRSQDAVHTLRSRQ